MQALTINNKYFLYIIFQISIFCHIVRFLYQDYTKYKFNRRSLYEIQGQMSLKNIRKKIVRQYPLFRFVTRYILQV